MNRHTLQRITRLGTQASLALAVAAALTIPLRAEAGSFQLPTDNAAGWARANAGGSLFPDDPTAVYNNPAAMAFFTAPLLQVTGTGIRPSAEFQGQFRDEQGNPCEVDRHVRIDGECRESGTELHVCILTTESCV